MRRVRYFAAVALVVVVVGPRVYLGEGKRKSLDEMR